MSIPLTFTILAELALTAFIVWGFFHEDRFIRFERRIGARIKKVFRKKKTRRPLRAVPGCRSPRPDTSAA